MHAAVAKRALVMTLFVAGCTGSAAPTSLPLAATAAPIAATPTSIAQTTVPVTTAPATTAPSPDVTPEPVEPSRTPSPPCVANADTTPDLFQPDAIVCVLEGDLRLRSRPSTADDSLKFDPLLQAGERLFVIDGPTDGSGYAWYLVERTPGYPVRPDGWVAGGAKDGTPWLAVAAVTCPAEPSLQDLASMDPMERFHCYHDREFTFTGALVAGYMCGDGNVLKSPTWMVSCLTVFAWGPRSTALVAVPPDLAAKIADVEYDVDFQATVTAHMDDDQAQLCVPYEGVEADYALLNAGVITFCRTMFVATSLERIAP